jgi:hypothetical protein
MCFSIWKVYRARWDLGLDLGIAGGFGIWELGIAGGFGIWELGFAGGLGIWDLGFGIWDLS